MPRKKLNKSKTVVKQGLKMRLMEISFRVDDYIYKNRSIILEEAEQYINEISHYRTQCSNDVHTLQVIEKLTRCMTTIIEQIRENVPLSENITASKNERNVDLLPETYVNNKRDGSNISEDEACFRPNIEVINTNKDQEVSSIFNIENEEQGDKIDSKLPVNNENINHISYGASYKLEDEQKPKRYRRKNTNGVKKPRQKCVLSKKNSKVTQNPSSNTLNLEAIISTNSSKLMRTYKPNKTRVFKNNAKKNMPCKVSKPKKSTPIKNITLKNFNEDNTSLFSASSNKHIHTDAALPLQTAHNVRGAGHSVHQDVISEQMGALQINNKCVPNDLSWVENIRYVREISSVEFDPSLILCNETFWENLSLPNGWNDVDFLD